MTHIIDTKSRHRRSATLTAGLVITAMLAVGAFAASASAEDRDYHHGYHHGYYRAPPVVYGSPYRSSYYGAPYRYYPPPVVYGSGIGISLPGINIGIR
jgi:hypothetical protein